MQIHNKGFKATRDRAVLINSYHVMCKDFRVPKDKQLDAGRLASMSNEMLFKVNKDMYSQSTVKQAKKLAVKMGLLPKPETLFTKIASWFKRAIKKIALNIRKKQRDYKVVAVDHATRTVTIEGTKRA